MKIIENTFYSMMNNLSDLRLIGLFNDASISMMICVYLIPFNLCACIMCMQPNFIGLL